LAKVVIVDAGPLIALAKVNRLDVLQSLFSTIWITTSVKNECIAKPGKDSEIIISALSPEVNSLEAGRSDKNSSDKNSSGISKITWIKEIEIQSNRQNYPKSLGIGEIDSLELAKQLIEQNKECLIILDDHLARKFAAKSKIPFIGTVRLLDIAEQQGIIKNAELIINKISSNGYRISREILKLIRSL